MQVVERRAETWRGRLPSDDFPNLFLLNASTATSHSTMSTTVLQYPPSPSSRSRNSYLSVENKRDSLASTSVASYETALASAVSISDSATPSVHDEQGPSSHRPQPSPPAKVNPLHLLANSQNDGSTAPIHITRVSQDTVYVKQESSPSSVAPINGHPRVVQVGKAIIGGLDHSAQRVATIVTQPIVHHHQQQHHHQSSTSPFGKDGSMHANAMANMAVEGPNGLTPPPSPPSTENFHPGFAFGGAGGVVLGGPTFDEPVMAEATSPPSTPTKTAPSGTAYSTPSEHHLFLSICWFCSS